MKIALSILFLLFGVSIYFKGPLAHNLSRGYQKLFAVCNYDYQLLFDERVYKELSWKEKIFCKKECLSSDVLDFLHHIEEREKLSMVHHRKREVDQVVLNGQKFVVKSMEFSGFFANIFRMGLGVNVWNNAIFAKNKKIDVIEPIAMIEKRKVMSTKTFVIYPFVGKVCENEFRKSQDWFFKVQNLMNKMLKKKVVHDDFRMKNIVMLENGSLKLIDIDKIHTYPRKSVIFNARMKREGKKFNKNLHENFDTKCEIQANNRFYQQFKPIVHGLMCLYRKMFHFFHYNYEGLFDSNVISSGSWSKKLFLQKSFEVENIQDKKMLFDYSDRKVEEGFIDGKKVIIKTFELNGVFSNLLQMGRGVNIWNHTYFAKQDGIQVLKPVALIEERTLFKTTTTLIYLYEGEVCTKNELDKIFKLKCMLDGKHIAHHDFHMRNIVMLEDGSLQLIDIDKMHWYPKRSVLFDIKKEHDEERFFRSL